jgi:toxin-antitoxin system PIN domain toxin
MFLLDVNVLIALIVPTHVFHARAEAWFTVVRAQGWATCPITELGVLRILSNPRLPNSVGSPAVAAEMLAILKAGPGHEFWPDDVSVFDRSVWDASKLLTSGQVTDSYLLALAASRDGKLATFDVRLNTTAVQNGSTALYLIP